MRSASGRGKPLSAPTRERIMLIVAAYNFGTVHARPATTTANFSITAASSSDARVNIREHPRGWHRIQIRGRPESRFTLHLLYGHRVQMSRQRVRKVACDGDGDHKKALRGRRRLCSRTRVRATRATTLKHSLGISAHCCSSRASGDRVDTQLNSQMIQGFYV
jgi:hypothetical protein